MIDAETTSQPGSAASSAALHTGTLSTTKLRVLIVTPSLPYPPIWGFGIRVLQIVQQLARRGHDVSLLTYAGPDEADKVAAMRQACDVAANGGTGVTVYAVPPPTLQGGKRTAQLASLVSRRSFQSRSLHSSTMQVKINELLAQQPWDIIQVESSQMSGFDFGRHSLVLLDEHNIEYELLYRMYRTEKAPVRRLFSGVEYAKFRREEQRSWQRADGCILTSEREEKILRRFQPGKPTTVAPNGVDVAYFQASPTPPTPGHIVMTGLMRYRPNIDAAIYFVQDILPHIHRVRPDATFTIVGAGPPDEVIRLAGSRVVVTGTVPDVRPYVNDAALLVVPLRMGSGTRLKVLEGLAAAKPLVSTSLGCEGIHVRHDEHLLIADSPDAFADAVLRLLDDAALATRLGRYGRALVEREYSWQRVIGDLEQFYFNVLQVAADGRGARPQEH